MTKKLLMIIITVCICLGSLCLTGCGSNEVSLESRFIDTNSKIDEQTQEYITLLIESWTSAYKNHDLLLYNDSVCNKLEYSNSSKEESNKTKNFFDTVTDCEIINIDFTNAKIAKEKQYIIDVAYTITYNDDFKEENGLKKGKNTVDAQLTINESSNSQFYIDDITTLKPQ